MLDLAWSVARLIPVVALVALGACQKPLEGALQAGDAAARAGRWEDARKAWTEATGLDARSVAAQVKLGVALWELGKHEEAAAAWARAVAVDPQAEEALEGLARFDLEQRDAGAAVQRLSVVKAPTRASFEALAARALLARGAPDDAAAALTAAQRALAAQPGDPELEYLVGCAQIALRQFANAQGTLEALLRRQPQSPLGSYGLARLAAAQQRPTDALLHLANARAAAGSGWKPAQVAADPAFAFLDSAPEFRALLK